jgi:hypothetical protein
VTVSAVVGQTTGANVGGASAVSDAFPGNITNGNLITVIAWSYNNTGVTTFVAGDCAKTAGTATIGTISLDKQLSADLGGGEYINVGIWSALVTGTGSATMQISNQPSDATIDISIAEFSTTTTWDAGRVTDSNAAQHTGTNVNSGSASSSGVALFIGGFNINASSSGLALTTNNSFTDIYKRDGSGGDQPGGGAYRIVSTGTTTSSDYTSTNSGDSLALVVVYTPTGGGGASAFIPIIGRGPGMALVGRSGLVN